jgi:hypothetical protein
VSGKLPKRLRGSNQKVYGTVPVLVAYRAMLDRFHRITGSTLTYSYLFFCQLGKPHWPHRHTVVSQPQGRGMAEGVEERRSKRKPTL